MTLDIQASQTRILLLRFAGFVLGLTVVHFAVSIATGVFFLKRFWLMIVLYAVIGLLVGFFQHRRSDVHVIDDVIYGPGSPSTDRERIAISDIDPARTRRMWFPGSAGILIVSRDGRKMRLYRAHYSAQDWEALEACLVGESGVLAR